MLGAGVGVVLTGGLCVAGVFHRGACGGRRNDLELRQGIRVALAGVLGAGVGCGTHRG